MNISAIIPCYNCESFIEETLRSVLDQTYKPSEIILVDDCSNDRSLEIIRAFNSIKIFRNEENKGRSFSRNLGAKLSKGDFICFLDSDDLWDKDYLLSIKDYLKDYDLIYSIPRTFIDEKSKILRKTKKNYPLKESVFLGMVGYPSGICVKKSSFLFFDESLHQREDWDLFIRYILENKKILFLDIDKVFIREHKRRSSKSKDFFYYTIKLYEKYKNLIPKEYLSYFYYHLSLISFRFKEKDTGFKFLFKALKENPKIVFDRRRFFEIGKRLFKI